jgi:LysR family transcriptional regulator, hydrogen peroxide-inducible genes activator
MELHQLRYATAVARTGNFSRAAEECHVSQPSLSQQIQKLEEELGERLFDRLKRAAKPTAHGELFLLRAIRILEEVEAAQREAKDAAGLLRGVVTIGVLPTIAPYLLPGVIERFLRQYPGVEVVIQEQTTAQLVKLVIGCEIDLLVASLPQTDPRLEVRALFSEELLVALPTGHPLCRKPRLTVRDLKGERFIVMKEGHCLGDQVLNFCEQRDVRPTIQCRSAQLETIRAFVAAGMGLSLIPAMAINRPGFPCPEYRPMQGAKPHRTIVTAWLKQRPIGRAGMEFLRILSERPETVA